MSLFSIMASFFQRKLYLPVYNCTELALINRIHFNVINKLNSYWHSQVIVHFDL